MNGATLSRIGRALFGDHWRASFEREFNIGNRTLRRMIDDRHDIPAGLRQDMETALRDRSHAIDGLLETLAETQ